MTLGKGAHDVMKRFYHFSELKMPHSFHVKKYVISQDFPTFITIYMTVNYGGKASITGVCIRIMIRNGKNCCYKNPLIVVT